MGSKNAGTSSQQRHGSAGYRSAGVAFGSFAPITDARSGASEELARRQRRYAFTMAFRTACFIAMIFVPGVFRWILFAAAVLLPYVAVIFANQVNERAQGTYSGTGEPSDAPAVTTGDDRPRLTTSEIISSEADEDAADQRPDRRDHRVA
ncbi:MAG: DUF3099 domain-containing protein [Microlunatus sp.]